METGSPAENKTSWLDRPINSFLPKFTIEHLLIVLIIIAAVFSRFYNVGLRVMSHDEVNHVVPSYELYQGRGYSHDPVTHGPLQFHLLASSYFLFGDSDFSSRIPAALFSVATVAFVLFAYKRYLGKTGALLAGLFMLISPYMLFYGRYTRNEAFVALFGVIMLYTVLRYLENGKHSNLYAFTAVLALHFVTKETSFIYTAELLIFLAVILIRDVTQKEWKQPRQRNLFILVTMAALLFIGLALGAAILNSGKAGGETNGAMTPVYHTMMLISLGLAAITLISAVVLMLVGLGWQVVKNIRSFDLLILTITMILPQLIAFPINLLGWDPLDYSQPGLIRTSIFLAVAVSISFLFGLLWKPRLWLGNMALFYAIFTVFYTTFFTNGQGFFTGLVGSLGYWLSQQGVNRGSQPWYFFAFLQLPMYEYLPVLGTILALIVGWKRKLFSTIPGISPKQQVTAEIESLQMELPRSDSPDAVQDENPRKLPVLSLLLYWSVISLIAFSVAGEKMPWLTVHITLPLILTAGFGIGYLVESTPFKRLASNKGYLALVLLPIFLISLGAFLGFITSANRPFAGNNLEQLKTTSTFLFALITAAVSGWGLFRLLYSWTASEIFKIFLVTFFALLSVLTARSAFQASFINYDTAKEFLVYAHSARGPKDVLEQVEQISQRTVGGKDIQVAYIGDALYPYWWYFRDYPNKLWYKDQLTRDLLKYPVVITDDEQLTKTKAILKDNYVQTKYKRLVWPMQDYFNLTWKRIWEAVKNPQMRQAIFNIWLNKDYTLYSSVTGNNGLTLENWNPSGNIYLFVKKDIVSQIWEYGTLPAQSETVTVDPYESKFIELTPDQMFGSSGTLEGQFASPRGIAVAPDGSIYVADSRNHRIQKFDAEGKFQLSWGTYGNIDAGDAPAGTFNEPWGIAVAQNGMVYVADTWNHRIQKFTANGKFIAMWGEPGLAETENKFWGPRGIAVDRIGNVFVTDTGNNRVVVFDGNGGIITQFGINGIGSGEFDEPVGIAVDDAGKIYVADTWNQRIQVFEPTASGTYQFLKEWQISGWYGQSVNNKPFLALDADANVYVTDPDGYRVLEFDDQGDLIRNWGQYSSGIDGFGSPSGIAVDSDGKVWISDAENNFVLRFTLPTTAPILPGLPELPLGPEGLHYNSDSGMIDNALNRSVYQLNSEKNEWQPVVPDEIAGLLQSNAQPSRDEENNWVLTSPDGSPVFRWDPMLLLWISTNPAS